MLLHLQDGQSGATLPSVLADMCHNMISSPAHPPSQGLDARCSGFALDLASQIAVFKRTNGGSTIDVPGNDEVCNLPTGVEWVRNSGRQCYNTVRAIVHVSLERAACCTFSLACKLYPWLRTGLHELDLACTSCTTSH